VYQKESPVLHSAGFVAPLLVTDTNITKFISTKVEPPKGISQFVSWQYKIDQLRSRVLEINNRLDALHKNREEAEKQVDDAFHYMQLAFNEYKKQYDTQLALPAGSRDKNILLASARVVAQAQSDHYDLTDQWVDLNSDMISEQVDLEKNKGALHNAIDKAIKKLVTVNPNKNV